MPSPRPKPTHLKVVAGNPGKRKLNKAEPKPKREVPTCPANLSHVGKVSWGRFSVLLSDMGVLTIADGPALERLCECYSEIQSCSEAIEREGRFYTRDGLVKAHPAVGMLSDADRRFKSYLVEFGLSPSSRTRLHADNADAHTSEKSQAGTGRFF